MSEDNSKNGGRLPPPAFPPGSRRQVSRAPGSVSQEGGGREERSQGPFISPDDPIPLRADPVSSALIQPDDPIPARQSEIMDSAFISPEDPIPLREPLGARQTIGMPEEGVVTSIGSDAHIDKGELAAAGDPHVMELTEAVGKLAQALRRRGEAGLRTSPGMSRFDATLRAYCVGYLAGRRAEGESEFLDWGEVSKEDA